jgi:hypothetical protein
MSMIWSLLNSILFAKQHYDIDTLDINELKPYQHSKLNVEPIQVLKFTISMNFIQLVYP